MQLPTTELTEVYNVNQFFCLFLLSKQLAAKTDLLRNIRVIPTCDNNYLDTKGLEFFNRLFYFTVLWNYQYLRI